MPWVKDATTLKPKIVYIAPVEVSPITRVIFNPKPKPGETPWVIEYAWLNTQNSTVADVEHLMGL